MTLESILSILQKIKERCEAATEGPWMVNEAWGHEPNGKRHLCFHEIKDSDNNYIGSTWAKPHLGNANLIAHARTDVPMQNEMLTTILEVLGEYEPEVLEFLEPYLEKIAEKYNG